MSRQTKSLAGASPNTPPPVPRKGSQQAKDMTGISLSTSPVVGFGGRSSGNTIQAQRSNSGLHRVTTIIQDKQIPSIAFWFTVTLIAGAAVACICLMLWSTISPFEKGTTHITQLQSEWADTTIAYVASFGMIVAIALYFLDFYTCPQLNHGIFSTKVEIETDLDDMQDDLDDYQANKRTTIEKLKNFGRKFTSRRSRDSIKLDRPKSSTEQSVWLKSHGLTADTASTFFNPDNYAAYVKGVKDAKPPKFAIGGRTGVSNLGTALARSYFAMALLLILSYGLIKSDEYPARPMLMSLLLFPAAMAFLRVLFRPNQHPQPNPLFEMELATCVMKTHQHDLSTKGKTAYGEAKEHLSHMLIDKTIQETDKYNFYYGLAASTLTNTVALIVLYAWWTYAEPGYQWDDETKETLSKRGVDDDETQWVIWAGPAIVIMAYMCLGAMFALRTYVHAEYSHCDDVLLEIGALINGQLDGAGGQAETKKKVIEEQQRDMERAVKMTFLGITFLGLGFWLAAEAAAANPVIAHTVKQFLLGFMLIFGIFVCHTMSRFASSVKSKMGENFFLKMMVGALKSDWLKAFVTLINPYAIPMYAILSCVNQYIRKCRGIEDMRDFGDEKALLIEGDTFTKSARRSFKKMSLWNWTSIVGKAYVLGIAMFTLNVVAEKCIYLLLIYVGETFDGIDMEPVSKAFLILVLWYCVGIVGFLLPPVPGPPIYLFGGVVVVRAFDNCGGEGFWYGVVIVIFTSLVLKLNACAMQQKLIGEKLGGAAWVRAACGVQTPFIRAVELILKQDGLTSGKVAILCGGPDWPTSVLTGLLHCDLSQMMIGTSPIIVLVAPTVLTGAFFLQEDPVYSTVGTMLFMASLIICCVLGLLATYSVQDQLEAHPNYLKIKLARNRDLDWLDFKSSRLSDVHYAVNKWDDIPVWLRAYMVAGLLVMNYALFLFTWYSDSCFGEFDLQTPSDHFSEDTSDDLTYIELITPMGYRALLFFAIACFVFYTYRKALQARADVKRAEVEDELNKPETYQSWLDVCATETAAQEADMRRGEPEDYAKYIAERDAFAAEAAVHEGEAASSGEGVPAGADARRSAALKSDPHRLALKKKTGGDEEI